MSLEATKLELMHLLLQTQKESLLVKLKKKIEDEQIDWWDEMSKEECQEVEKGLNQADKQDYITNKIIMKRFDEWH